MSGIFSTLSVARSALLAQSAAIRTVGQNIANAGTEGYTRQRVNFAAARPEQLGHLSLGTGVEISRIERMIDEQLEESIRNAGTSLKDLETKSSVLSRLEATLNELDGQGIGPALEQFFAALNDLAARPEDQTLRRQLVAAGDALSEAFGFAASSLRTARTDLNDEVVTSVGEINRLSVEIAQLNEQIVLAEHGGQNRGTANDLRDQRGLLVKQLAGLVNLKAVETSTGAVNVMVEGEWLVFGQQAAELTMEHSAADGVLLTTVRLASDGKLFAPQSGALGALLTARDEIVTDVSGDMDTLSSALIEQINRTHSQGEGLTRFTDLTGQTAVTSPTAQLDQAGLPFTITDGRFFFSVKNENTGHVDRYDIDVNLSGSPSPMSLDDLAAAINQAVATEHPTVRARVTNDFRLEITTQSPSVTFGFEEDTSGALAALGMNTFFTGSRAADLTVSDLVRNDLDTIATGQGGGPADSSNVLAMLAVRDQPVLEGASLEAWWQGRIGALGVEQAQTRALAENQQAIHDHLVNQREALSGVNIDEEAINLIQYQRAFQGAARLLSVVDELVRTLLQAV